MSGSATNIGDGMLPAGHGQPRVDPNGREVVAFAVAGRRYAVELGAVERTVRMVAVTPLPQAPDVALGAINVHGEVVPVLDVRRRLGLPVHEYGPTARLLLARTPRRRVALAADEVLGVTRVTADAVVPAADLFPGSGDVAGVAALDDGLLYVHDLEAFLSPDEERELEDALRTAAP